MFAHFLFELGFPPKSLASYFMGVVWIDRSSLIIYANLLCRMAVHSWKFRSQTCSDLELTSNCLPHVYLRKVCMPRSNAALGENLFPCPTLLRWSSKSRMSCNWSGESTLKKLRKKIFSHLGENRFWKFRFSKKNKFLKIRWNFENFDF